MSIEKKIYVIENWTDYEETEMLLYETYLSHEEMKNTIWTVNHVFDFSMVLVCAFRTAGEYEGLTYMNLDCCKQITTKDLCKMIGRKGNE